MRGLLDDTDVILALLVDSRCIFLNFLYFLRCACIRILFILFILAAGSAARSYRQKH